MSFIQFILILLYCFIYFYDYWNIDIMFYASTPICNGFFVGLIMGNPLVGLSIGATLQLMQLGGVGYGGASAPEYDIGTIIATIVCAVSGQSADFGLAIGLPVSLLMIQLDVVVKTISTFLVHKSQGCLKAGKERNMYSWLLSGLGVWSLKPMLPVILLYIIGADKVAALVDKVPMFITGALSVAGNLLPALGIAVLMKYMNVKEYFVYLLLGYVLMSYFGLSMIGTALVGFIVAYITYKNSKTQLIVQPETVVTANTELEEDEDEL